MIVGKSSQQFPLSALIKAGFHRDPMILDIAEIIECRALQDLKWRARVKLQSGVYLIGQLFFHAIVAAELTYRHR